MKRIAMLPLLFSLLVLSASAQVKLLRHPDYHSGKVTFSYLGDIWTANEDGSSVQRLTVHSARDVYPRFSPDGKWIAFSSNRYGNYDVYIIPVQGGSPRQLTFHSGNDIVVGWRPDSRKVIFQASRGRVFPGIPSLYEVSVDGGLEHPLPADWGYWGSYSPDGKKFAFNRHPMVWWRKHYRGSYAADLWVMDVTQRKFTHLGDDIYKGNYFWPMYGAKGEIYFVSDRLPDEAKIKPGSPEVLKSVNNIWKLSERGGSPVQVTHHKDGNLFFPSISHDGKVIVYEEDFGLWKLDTVTGKSSEIKINIGSDDKNNAVETLVVKEADAYSLSPSTKRAAISARGEIFSIPTDKGDVQQVTNTFSRESQPSWSPDGKWIAFVSDKGGRDEVWIAHEDGSGLKALSSSETEKQDPQWSPDGKSLVYAASDHKLYRVELETGAAKVVAGSEVGNIQGARFSPDGKWLAYSKLDSNLRPHVYISAATGGEEHRVADERLFAENSPIWTRDGKRLLFLAGSAQLGSATVRRSQVQLYSVSLSKEDKRLGDKGVDSEEEAAKADREDRGLRRVRGEGQGEGAAEPAKAVEVKIDFDGIARRARQITHLSDSIASPAASPDGKLYAFVASSEEEGRPVASLYTVLEDGSQLTRVAESRGGDAEESGGPRRMLSHLSFSKDGRTIYFLENNTLNAVEVSAGNAPGTSARTATARSFERRRINFSVRVTVDHRAERQQVFAESWRIMKHRFYDPSMHGVDWAAARSIYEPLLDFAADQEEMHNVISQMIGELNASHTGISAMPTADERERMVQTRYPGFEIESDAAAGLYKVTRLYRRGPADKDYVNIAVGNYILAVNGAELKAGDNYWKLYNTTRGAKMEFTVNSKPAAAGAWKARVEPVGAGAYATLEYEAWVEDRRQMVDRLSNGDIGYLHIRQMNAQSLAQFERDLVANQGKKALIIDQRFNPGGGIDQELLAILGQRQYQRTRARDSIEISRPQQGFFGPMVVMQNERSTSDAEVFPDGFRTLGLGKVVGTPTYGAVIGTGAYQLMDGSTIRTPGTGLWSVKGYNLENYGVPPDVYIDNTPEDFLAGRDAQLEKAVEILKQDMKAVPLKAAGR